MDTFKDYVNILINIIICIVIKQHPTKQEQYAYLPPISKTSKTNKTCGTLLEKQVTFFYGPIHILMAVLADQPELTNNSSARTQDRVWKTYWKRWMSGTGGGERERQGNPCCQLDLMFMMMMLITYVSKSWRP